MSHCHSEMMKEFEEDMLLDDVHPQRAHEKAYHNVLDIVESIQLNDKDAINPQHYKVGGIETIEYMKAKSTPEEFRGHLRLTALKYLSRAGHKDDELKEYKKAKWYLDRLIDELS